MSDKFTKIIAVFAIIFICGIMISALMPDKEDAPQEKSAEISTFLPAAGQKTETTQTSVQESGVKSVLYYYNALSQEEKVVYDQMYQAILNREDVKVETKDENVVKKVFECVTNDHPEIFYCASYKIETMQAYDTVVQLKFAPNYHMTEETVEECSRQIDEYVNRCIASIPAGADDYTKIKYVYEYIIKNTEYVPNAKNNQNICSVFIEGESVCMGYAKATQYILSKLGMDVTLAFGTVGGESHSWNLVRVDGEYYYVDTTWGDAGYVRPNAVSSAISGYAINYEYFLITTEQISKSHVIDNIVPLPACVATRNNYFVREGLYLRMYDQATLSAIFDRMQTSGDASVSFRCVDFAVYEEAKNRLIANQEIFNYVDSNTSIAYSYNDDLYTLIFWIE